MTIGLLFCPAWAFDSPLCHHFKEHQFRWHIAKSCQTLNNCYTKQIIKTFNSDIFLSKIYSYYFVCRGFLNNLYNANLVNFNVEKITIWQFDKFGLFPGSIWRLLLDRSCLRIWLSLFLLGLIFVSVYQSLSLPFYISLSLSLSLSICTSYCIYGRFTLLLEDYCPTEAALMLPKYGCTGTPHPAVVQTRVDLYYWCGYIQ